MQLVNSPFGRNTDGRHEKLGAALDDNVNQLRELALGVVGVGLARVATDLGEQKVDTEGSVLVVQAFLDFRDLATEEVGGVLFARMGVKERRGEKGSARDQDARRDVGYARRHRQ